MLTVIFAVVVLVGLLCVWERWGRALVMGAVIAVLTLSVAAFAGDTQPAAEVVRLSSLTTSVLPMLLVLAGNPTVWAIMGGLVWFQFAAKSKYAGLLHSAIDIAFHAVEDMKAQGKLPDNLTKEAAALEKLEAILNTHGYKLSDAATELAKIAWQALNSKLNNSSIVTTGRTVDLP